MKLLSVGLLCLISMLCVGCQPTATPTAGGADEAAPQIVAQQALAGVGKQGQKLQQHSDAQKIITGPANALLQFGQKAELEFKVPHALQLFQAAEGRFPKSHEEFMEKIVAANQIKLPELPEGAVYRFNTEKGELWVYPEDEVPE